MFYVIVQRKVPAKSQVSGEGEARETVRNVLALQRVKVMTMFRMSEKAKGMLGKMERFSELIAKRGERVTSQIRIQLEDIKGKVLALSPSVLQFIGPGDH
ncbi:hypothetical protein R4Z10_18700 [Niallia sp. XMNu-256]|uniref:hypothetical protein n=1 Tax=Niallia sp. XMNu-256 TaxID=3082444 RepID=UPI0030CF212B